MSSDEFAGWIADTGKLDRVLRILGVMTAAEMERFIDGTTNLYVVADRDWDAKRPK